MDRRDFILGATALIAGCSKGGDLVAGVEAKAPLGVQLYSVRGLMAEDAMATLDLVAGIGYEEVELHDHYGHSAAEFRSLLDNAGLSASAAHVGYNVFSDDIERVIGDAAELGYRYVIVPWLAQEQRSLDDYRRHSENFNRWGEALAAEGLQFAYHNHEFEFEETDGQIPYDLLLAETDPDLVKMELDLAWAHKGNVDVVAYFKAWPGRFPAIHIKDMDASGAEADIGTGSVPFEEIFAHAEVAGLKHGFVERDNAADPALAIEKNYAAIRPLWTEMMPAGG